MKRIAVPSGMYTRGVLTEIALLLAVIAVKRLISPDAIASAQGSNGQKSSPVVGVDADQTLIVAKKYHTLQQYAQALPLFVKAAEGMNGEAALYLGVMYANGRGGLAKDEAQAVSWYRKAADGGDAHGMSNLGFMYANGQGGLPRDEAQAVSWYRKAADAGEAQALAALKRLGK